jgi:hypothetical protein
VDVGAALEAEVADVDTELKVELCTEALVFAESEIVELLVTVLLLELGLEDDRSTTLLLEVGAVDVSDTVVIDAEVETIVKEVDAAAVLKTLPPGASYQTPSVYCFRDRYPRTNLQSLLRRR